MSSALADDLTCAICLQYVLEPAVTSCGHVFDVHCLRTWLASSKPSRCPFCRTAQPTSDCTVCIPLLRALEHIAAPEFVSRQAVARQADEIAVLCKSGGLDALEQLRASEDAGVWAHRLAARTSDGSTALHVAVAAGRVEVVRFLIGTGSNPTLLTNEGRDALGVCVDGVTARELLRAPSLLANRSGRQRLTPIMPYNNLTPEGASPLDKALDRAITYGSNAEIVVALLKRGATPDRGALRRAATKGDTATCEALLTHYQPSAAEDAKYLEDIECLLREEHDSYETDQQWRQLVWLLRTYPWLRTTCTIPQKYDLWGQAWEVHVESERDGDFDEELPMTIWERLDGDQAVRTAAQSGEMGTLIALLNHPSRAKDDGADVDLRENADSDADDEDQRTALHYASEVGHA